MTDRSSAAPPAARKVWHARNRLPHWEAGETPQHITFRLADSLPPDFRKQLRASLVASPVNDAQRERYKAIARKLDQHAGACHLRDPTVGRYVEDALHHFDGQRHRLHAWVVMPNHVHVLVTPLGANTLSSLLHTWKSFTAKQANRHLGRAGAFWAEEYYDRAIRDDQHYRATVAYIERNPVDSGLCAAPADWPLSSARARLAPQG